MSWINQHKRAWRVVILALLVMAIMGPWAFDLIIVPSEYPCSSSIRLKGDYCGTPLSGMWILSALVIELISMVVGLVTGATAFTELGRGFLLILLALLLLLPLVSTLLLILPGNRQRLQILHVGVWGMAAVSSLWLLLATSASELPPAHLWGLWLYIGLAPCVFVLEGLAFAMRMRPSQAR